VHEGASARESLHRFPRGRSALAVGQGGWPHSETGMPMVPFRLSAGLSRTQSSVVPGRPPAVSPHALKADPLPPGTTSGTVALSTLERRPLRRALWHPLSSTGALGSVRSAHERRSCQLRRRKGWYWPRRGGREFTSRRLRGASKSPANRLWAMGPRRSRLRRRDSWVEELGGPGSWARSTDPEPKVVPARRRRVRSVVSRTTRSK